MSDHDIYKDVGLKLKAYRRQRKLTIETVGKKLNRSTATISKYESGEIAIGLDVLRDYCSLLNMDMAKILEIGHEGEISRENERYTSSFIEHLWVYWYKHSEKKIHINALECDNYTMTATFFHDVKDTKNVYDCDFIYHGDVIYSDHNIDFIFRNIGAPYDVITMRLPTLTRKKAYRIGMMLSTDFMYRSVGLKCLTSEKLITNNNFLVEKLKISASEIKWLREVNFFMIDTE